MKERQYRLAVKERVMKIIEENNKEDGENMNESFAIFYKLVKSALHSLLPSILLSADGYDILWKCGTCTQYFMQK